MVNNLILVNLLTELPVKYCLEEEDFVLIELLYFNTTKSLSFAKRYNRFSDKIKEIYLDKFRTMRNSIYWNKLTIEFYK